MLPITIDVIHVERQTTLLKSQQFLSYVDISKNSVYPGLSKRNQEIWLLYFYSGLCNLVMAYIYLLDLYWMGISHSQISGLHAW